MKLIYEGHACFTVLTKGVNLLIDPFITGNPMCRKKPEDFHPDAILITHAHDDHLGNAVEIARRTGAVLIGQVDLFKALDAGDMETIGFQYSGHTNFRGIDIQMTQAWHGNSLMTVTGVKPAGISCGYIIDDGEKTLYHAGDTGLFGDMKTVIGRKRLDCALLPIGDFYTMGPEDAAVAAEWLRPSLVVPMHYNTFPVIEQDAEAFARMTPCPCKVMAPEDELEL